MNPATKQALRDLATWFWLTAAIALAAGGVIAAVIAFGKAWGVKFVTLPAGDVTMWTYVAIACAAGRMASR